MNNHEESRKHLEDRNLQLQSELDAYKSAAEKNRQIKWWVAKKVVRIFLGKGLNSAIKQGLNEFSEEKKITKDTLSDLIAALIRRFVKVGAVALFLALLPTAILLLQTYLLHQQNKRIDIQNNRLEQQTYLQEAERRSALIFLYGNLLEVIDREIRESEKLKGTRSLSPQTIGQIVALSQRLKPYRYLENDTLISRPISPERSQLLVSLIESRLDSMTYRRIFSSAVFSYCDLSDVNFEGRDLSHINLSNSALRKSNLRRARLNSANLQNSVLDDVDLVKGILRFANLDESIIINSNFQYADLYGADFEYTNIDDSNFGFSTLGKSSFEHSVVKNSKFICTRFEPERLFQFESMDISMLGNLVIGNGTDTVLIEEDYKSIDQASFADASLMKVDFADANLSSVDFRGSKISNSDLTRTNLTLASFDFSLIRNIQLEKAYLDATSFKEVPLDNINFEGAVLPTKQAVGKARSSGVSTKDGRFEFKIADEAWNRFLSDASSIEKSPLGEAIVNSGKYEVEYLSSREVFSYEWSKPFLVSTWQKMAPYWWDSYININSKEAGMIELILVKERL